MLKILAIALLLLASVTSQAYAEEKRTISVTATVAAKASDYQLQIEKTTGGSDFSPNKEIEYKITYGSLFSTASNIKIEAYWYNGEIEGSGATVEILNYLSGTATNGYNGVSPVIDTVNKKISWTINNFPGNTNNRELKFKLKTNSSYSGTNKVNFKVSARILAPGLTTGFQNVTASFCNCQTKSSTTPTPTPTPTVSPSTTITPSPSVKPQIRQNSILSVGINSIDESSTRITVSSRNSSKLTIKYGKSQNSLTEAINTQDYNRESSTKIANLQGNTIYFFSVSAIDKSGQTANSDIYTFKTAKTSEIPKADIGSLVTSSNDIIIAPVQNKDKKTDEVKNNVLIITKDTTFQFKVAIKSQAKIKKVVAVVRNKKVLGLANFATEADAATDNIELVEIEPGIYTGKFRTKPLPGLYELYAQIYDEAGNITEQKIAELKVIGKFTVLDYKGKPIEGARVSLYSFSNNSNEFKFISSLVLSSGNPVFTNGDGEIDITLPPGTYKALVSRLGHKDVEVKFRIGQGENDVYPVVKLDRGNITPYLLIRYFYRTSVDIYLYNTILYTNALTGSTRFFELVAVITLMSLVLLCLFAFSKKHSIPIRSIATHFYYLLDHSRNAHKYITGVVYDKDEKPIPMANVYLSDEGKEEIIAKTKTNKLGEFIFKKSLDNFSLMAMRKGFETSPLVILENKPNLHIKITLERTVERFRILEKIKKVIDNAFALSFEILLAVTFMFEFLFLSSFGFIRTLPILSVSILNLLMWTFYLHRSHVKN